MANIGYGYGSEWHLLQYLGRRRAAFTRAVQDAVGCGDLQWRDHEEYAEPRSGLLKVRELRGLEFLAPDDPVRQEWERQWPQSGNVHNWDAIGEAKADGKTLWILLEAKAHLGELTSSCAATAEDSIRRIRDVLDRTRRDLGVAGQADWSRDYYQYCNRLALLHFLRHHDIDAHLVFVYFTGDRLDIGSASRECPVTQTGWLEALNRQDEHAGIPATSPIRRRVHRLFLPTYHANVAEGNVRGERTERPRPPSGGFASEPMPPATLAVAFDEAMMQVYLRAKNEAAYTPHRFLQMLQEHGGVETARRLLPEMSEGFAKLWERKRLDLTVEYVVLQPQWHTLFTDAERTVARNRLRECGLEI